jgi:antitoxin CcdA
MSDAPSRVRVNVTVDATLLAEARALRVNLSGTLDEALRDKLRTAPGEAFLRENAEGYEAVRRDFEENGLPLAQDRTF